MQPQASLNVLGFLLAALVATGCAHSGVVPPRLRASEWRQSPPGPGSGVILDFKAGDRIPVTIEVDGEVVATTPNPSTVWLTAKRDFSVRIVGSEIKTSLDGRHFDDKPAAPGQFQVGIGPAPEGGPQISVHLRTPVHAKP